MDLLLENGASVQGLRPGDYYGTHLNVAAAVGDMEIAKLLRRKGAHVDYVDGDHNTPLAVALTEENLAMAEFLLNEGDDYDLRVTEFDLSALDFARPADAVRLLIKYGEAVNDVSQCGTRLSIRQRNAPLWNPLKRSWRLEQISKQGTWQAINPCTTLPGAATAKRSAAKGSAPTPPSPS